MFYLIGETLKHSYSKQIHSQFGTDYQLKEIIKTELKDFFIQKNFQGLNVTIPYKESVIEYLDTIDGIAKEIGAVNTVINKDGKLIGYNTDYYGLKSLFDGQRVNGKTVMVLGTGGTSKTAIKVVEDLNCKAVYNVGRHSKINYNNCYDCTDTEIIVNTTPVGMFPNISECPLDITKFSKLKFVVDVIYNPYNSLLIQKAKQNNICCIGGLKMLVAQAYFTNCLFKNQPFDFNLANVEIEKIYRKIRLDNCNVALIGMPSSGKSTIGKKLSKLLCKEVIDTDSLIVQKAGKTIPQIFTENGEEAFRNLEQEVVCSVAQQKGKIISLGGGAILREENRKALRYNCIIIYLDRKLDKLICKDRPLSKDNATLEKMFKERKPIYEQLADIRVKNINFKNCLQEIMEYLV